MTPPCPILWEGNMTKRELGYILFPTCVVLIVFYTGYFIWAASVALGVLVDWNP